MLLANCMFLFVISKLYQASIYKKIAKLEIFLITFDHKLKWIIKLK